MVSSVNAKFMAQEKEKKRQTRLAEEKLVEEWIIDESGGFSVAGNNDPFVNSTHTAVRSFDSWVPENAQQRRYKEMVRSIENRAMTEEDEHCFKNGSATGDFKNPI